MEGCKRWLIASILLSLCAFSPLAWADPPEIQWVADYNGPESDEDRIQDAFLRDGSFYVTGYTIVDYARAYITVKYGPEGAEQWSRTYEGFTGSNEPDQAGAITVDEAGNVYVTGWSTEGGQPSWIDATTLKYSRDGDLLWERRHRVPGHNAQTGAILLTDTGDLYVAGAAWDGDGFDALLLKYDLDGTPIWDRTYDGAGEWDATFHLAVDGDGNVLAGGYSELRANDLAMSVLKYTPDGTLLWDRTIDGFATSEEVADLAVDGAGNVYAVGELAQPGENQDLVTVKLDPDGVILWIDGYSGGGPSGEAAAGIELTPGGDVVVAGKSWHPDNDIRMVVRKISAVGTPLWTRHHLAGYAQSTGTDLALDAEGNAYVAGYGYNSNNREDWITVRYDPEGNLDWSVVYAAPEG
ncbi:MAG: hypothetical protein GF346_10370, partial [Candidatus Eisenbacteria bacterium]|nr:hypothetical protein [Candidatus Latescibacterota bacterium]MBD3302840.1 hypothetical protein [Candidatus Eisenbacteria bacterium]